MVFSWGETCFVQACCNILICETVLCFRYFKSVQACEKANLKMAYALEELPTPPYSAFNEIISLSCAERTGLAWEVLDIKKNGKTEVLGVGMSHLGPCAPLPYGMAVRAVCLDSDDNSL